MRTSVRLAAAVVLLTAVTARSHAQEAPPSCAHDAGALPAETNPGGLHGDQIPIDTIVVLMQENRSFDHYFSRLGKNVERPPRHASNPDPLGGPPIERFH